MPTAADLFYFVHHSDEVDRPTVILIHGAGGTHLHWPPQLRRLPGFKILALDLPGHGKSGGIGRQIIADYARDVLQFMDVVEVPSAILVGHSMGGAIALHLALNIPERIKSLGLIGSGAKLRVVPEILSLAADPLSLNKTAHMIIEYSYSQNAAQSLKAIARKRLLESRPAVLYGDLLACNNFDVRDQLDKINAPTVILCGAEDRLTPLKYSEYLCARMPRARLDILPKAGHMVMLEQPAKTSEVIERFLLSPTAG